MGPAHDTNYILISAASSIPPSGLRVDSERFSLAAAEELADRFLFVFQQFCDKHDRALADVSLITPTEQAAFDRGNREAPPSSRNLVDLFRDGVRRSPNRPARRAPAKR